MIKKQRGLLVTNAFLRTEKFVEHYEWLKKAADRRGISLEMTDNAAHMMGVEEEPVWLKAYDFVIYWDKDLFLGEKLSRFGDRYGIPVFNSPKAIGVSDDKYKTYQCLSEWNRLHEQEKIRLLPTVMAPMTYANVGYPTLTFLEHVEKMLGYPMVLKECCGSFGMQVYLVSDRKELEDMTRKLAGIPFFYQKYAAYSSGRDVRLQVVGDKVVAAMERYSEHGDFRANITNGGSMKPYQPNLAEEKLAVLVTKILGLDFAGVDLLFSEETKTADVVCEVNSNAHFKNIYTCTGVNVAEKILSYIMDRCRASDGCLFSTKRSVDKKETERKL
jgi:RimK family alpha-L-glutamate ligase